jgi:hypothetical protein
MSADELQYLETVFYTLAPFAALDNGLQVVSR